MALKKQLIRGAAGTFALKCFGLGASFVVSLILARTLGASDYGVYAYAMSWISVFSTAVMLGFDNLIVRYVATYSEQISWGLLRGLLRWSNVTLFFLAVAVGGLLYLMTLKSLFGMDPAMMAAFRMSLLLLPFLSLIRIRQSVMQGLKKVVLSQAPEALIQPVVFVFLLGVSLLVFKNVLNSYSVMILNVSACAIAFMAGTYFLVKTLPAPIKAAEPLYRKKVWLRSAAPLFLMSVFSIVNNQADTVLLGIMKDLRAVGVYNIAGKLTMLVSFVLVAANAVMAPNIAGLHVAGRKDKLQSMVTKSARLSFFATVPPVIVLIFAGDQILSFFGSEFVRGRSALTILSLGQLINVLMGSVGFLLIMTGNEKAAFAGIAMSTVVNILLIFIMVPQWGMEGAALAKTSSIFVWNIVLAYWVYKKLGIHSTALGVVQWKNG